MQKNAVNIGLLAAAGVTLIYIIKKFGSMNKEQLTKDFSISEFNSHDGAPMPADIQKNVKELAKNLQVIRDYIGKPIKINSGYRSPAYNATIKGAVKDSQHTKGKAADIVVSGMSPAEVGKKIIELINAGKIKQGGVGIYASWVHYDTRGTKARW